jgi:hypothetical protein
MLRTLIITAFCLGLLAPLTGEARVSSGPKPRAKVQRRVKGKRLRLRARLRYARMRVRRALRRRPVAKQVKQAKGSKQLVRKRTVRSRLRALRNKVRRVAKRLRRRVTHRMSRLSRKERRQVKTLLKAPRVRSSVSARYAVGSFLRLRTLKGGKGLPISVKDMKQIVSSKRWSSKRLRNLGRVLALANAIAKKEKVAPKVAFKRALKRMGIYGKYSRGVCGA